MIEIKDPSQPSPLILRPVMPAMLRGWSCKCPACGVGKLFSSYLKVETACPKCGQELHHHRADDAPPYFTILIVCHIVIGGMLTLEQAYAPATWVHLVIWLPLTLFLCLWLLPRVKGALVGLQWALCMHGFGGEAEHEAVAAEHAPSSSV